MIKKNLLFYLLFIIGITFGSTALAQVTTAAMNGLVTDTNGDPLPGATIVAVHTPTGTQYGTATLPSGRFNLPNIKVGGPYTITVSFVGYQDQKQEGISLSLGQNFTLDFKLQESNVQLSEVEVTSNRDDILNGNRTGAATNIRSEQIQALPTINRAVNDFARLTPQYSSNNSFNGFAGRNNLNNNFSLDGAVYNNVYGLTELPAGQTNAQPVSLDAIQELQIQIAPFDVRQGGFTGAGVNAITRSGTNEFSGSVYSFFKNQNLIGKKVGDATVVQNDFSDNQYGLRFGGPIIKNKLFFFVNAELTRVNEPAGTFRAARDGDTPGEGDVSRVNASTLDSLRTFLISKYGYDPGSYENYNFETQNDKFFVRFDWNINQSHKLTLRHNFVDASRDVGLSSSAPVAFGGRSISVDRLPFQNANYIINEKVNSTVLELNSTFGTRFANNLILTRTTLRNFREVPGGSTQFPHIEIGNGRGQGLTSFGYEPFSAENRLDQDYIQITDNFNIYAGRHVITVGTSNEFYNFDNSFLANYKGNYSFYSVQDFYAAANLPDTTTTLPLAIANARPVSYTLTYPQVTGTLPTAEFKAYQLSVYAQDEWQVSNTFKLTGGIRLDLPVFPDTFRENPAVTEAFGVQYDVSTAKLPKANVLFSPRVGFNWDVKGDRSFQLRGGSGIFSGRPLYAWIGSNVNLNGINYYDVSYTTNGGFTNLTGRPNVVFSPSIPQPTLPPTVARSQINVISPEFNFPQIWRTNFAIDYRLPLGIVATLEGMYSKDINAVFFRDINLVEPTSSIPGDDRQAFPAGNKPGVSPSIPNRIVDNRFTNVVLMENTNKGYQYFITASLQKNFSNGIFANIAYNYGRSEDLTSGSSSQPTSAFGNNQVVNNPNTPVLAISNYEQRHRLIANASYRIDYAKFAGTTFSLFYQAYSGSPYSYIYSGDLNRDGLGSNDLIYVPNDINDIVLVRVNATTRVATPAPQEDYDGLNTLIDQDPYLSENRGTYVDRNAAVTPWVFKLDARILQDFYVNVKGKRNTLQLSLDVINLGNLLNKKWGIVEQFNRNNFLTYVDTNGADGTAGNEDDRPRFSYSAINSSFINNTGITSRWQMQFGVRYIFN